MTVVGHLSVNDSPTQTLGDRNSHRNHVVHQNKHTHTLGLGLQYIKGPSPNWTAWKPH